MSKEKWNERYASEEFHYGTEPNDFLKDRLETIVPGKILFPAEGEGRNAVYAASKGWEVYSFDQSEAGKTKAMLLAKQKEVAITYDISSLEDWKCPENSFDAIALIFVHMPPSFRKEVHLNLLKSLKPGGLIILEAFNKKQRQNNSGGPKEEDLLFSESIILEDFSDLNPIFLKEETILLKEGHHHSGIADVVRFVGQKC